MGHNTAAIGGSENQRVEGSRAATIQSREETAVGSRTRKPRGRLKGKNVGSRDVSCRCGTMKPSHAGTPRVFSKLSDSAITKKKSPLSVSGSVRRVKGSAIWGYRTNKCYWKDSLPHGKLSLISLSTSMFAMWMDPFTPFPTVGGGWNLLYGPSDLKGIYYYLQIFYSVAHYCSMFFPVLGHYVGTYDLKISFFYS